MNSQTVKTINKSNKNLADELSAIFNTTCRYEYHYEKGRWIHGYDGEPGFELEDARTGTLGFPQLRLYFFLRCMNDNFKKEFRAFTLEEVLEQVEEQHKNYPEDDGVQYLKLQLDLSNTNQNKKAVVKV